jgi:hypothetical protein
MELAHTQRLAVWAEHGQPKAYGGSDLMREDIKATIAEVERMAELIYNLHVAPSPQDVAAGVRGGSPDAQQACNAPTKEQALRDLALIEDIWDMAPDLPYTKRLREFINAVPDGVMASEPIGPVAWEHRAWRDGGGGEPVGWGAWERVQPKGLQSIDDAVQEMIGYIQRGYRYELRSLFAVPHGVPACPGQTFPLADADAAAKKGTP